MSKFRLFVENFLIYGLGGIISKIIPFVMIPIITRLMPNTFYFGINDMVNVVVSLASAFAVFGMYDAMYRLFFEKEDEEYQKDICSTTLVFTLGLSVCVSCLLCFFRNEVAVYLFNDVELSYLIVISSITTLVSATNSIVSAPTRMQNKRKIFLLLNTVMPVISYSLAVYMLVKGEYYLALPVAALLSGFLSELFFLYLNRRWFSLKRFRLCYFKELIKIAFPLMPVFLVYWVFNSSNNMMITKILGIEYTGIYAVGAKLGHASQLIYLAFAGGWQYFAFSTMKDERQVENNSKVFEYLGVISFVATAYIFVFSETIYKWLFIGDFVKGYIVSPYLFLAPLLLMLFQVIANQFLVIKKTWPSTLILFVGAGINVGLNFFLIPLIGIEGAAISSVVGYVVTLILACFILVNMKLLVIRMRFMIAVFTFVLLAVLLRLNLLGEVHFNLISVFIYCLFCCMLYKSEVKFIVDKFRFLI